MTGRQTCISDSLRRSFSTTWRRSFSTTWRRSFSTTWRRSFSRRRSICLLIGWLATGNNVPRLTLSEFLLI
ncbi:hypothetical protein D9C73_028571 [Collichthys lucidus]|uniref:Uncharacterized protein n=1 Tax=Collichthys lucidus TaxID=240159 RepID=A0A4U5TYQ2_COLLU|nr:hypothetical protein D9C73_028571 [Collichthys lucidus]